MITRVDNILELALVDNSYIALRHEIRVEGHPVDIVYMGEDRPEAAVAGFDVKIIFANAQPQVCHLESHGVYPVLQILSLHYTQAKKAKYQYNVFIHRYLSFLPLLV